MTIERLGDSVWRVMEPTAAGAPEARCYAIATGPSALAIDLGLSDPLSPEELIRTIAPVAVTRLLLTPAPIGIGSRIEAWRAAGFSGELLNDGQARTVAAQACADADGELAELRVVNLNLRSAMVEASDAALRDGLSGLYGRAYADEFILSLLSAEGGFVCAFVELDRLKEINRELGVSGGDRIVADVAGFLSETAGEAFLFRWSGPAFLLVLQCGMDEALGRAESIRRAVEAERRFSRPVTVSVALVDSGEANGSGARERLDSIQAIARARLKLLERRGGNEVSAESALAVEEKAMALVMDGDPIASEYLVEYLERYGFTAIGAARGGEALELMERYKPEVVVADTYLPQFDAFQIRSRMLASADLRRVPFVLIADKKTDELIERAHAMRIYHVFEKPVPLSELAGVMRYLIRHEGDADQP